MTKKPKVEKVCYVCGLILDEYPYEPPFNLSNHSVICPCCGIHYGYDDGGAGDIIPDELAYSDWKFGDENHKKIIKFWRKRWIDNGMKWWFPYPDFPFESKPKNWDPEKQLQNIPEEFK